MKFFVSHRTNESSNPENNRNKNRKLRNDPFEIRSNNFKILSEVFYEYANNTKLSGFYYLRRGITSGYKRYSFAYTKLFTKKKKLFQTFMDMYSDNNFSVRWFVDVRVGGKLFRETNHYGDR